MISYKNIIFSVLRLILFIPFGMNRAVLKNRYYLRGIDVNDVHDILPQFFAENVKPRLSKPLLNRMNELREAGYMILLISGTLDILLRLFVNRLNCDGGASSIIEVKEGKFTGKIIGDYPYFRGKVRVLDRYLNNKSVDWKNSVSFADTWADIPLLSRFGSPVAVHPDWILKSVAKRKGWTIEYRAVKNAPAPLRFWFNHIYRKA